MAERILTRPRMVDRPTVRAYYLLLAEALNEAGVGRGDRFRVVKVDDTPDAAPESPVASDAAVNALGPSPAGKKTSKLAALSNYPRSGSQREELLRAMFERPERKWTREDLAAHTGLSGDTVRPRVLELVAGGWLEVDREHTARTEAGHRAEVLLLSDKAVRALDARDDERDRERRARLERPGDER